jgi:hypothetical protein
MAHAPRTLPNVARPKLTSDSRVTTAVRLPPELHQRLRAVADERHVAVNYLVVKALEDYLQRLIPIDEVALTRPVQRSR